MARITVSELAGLLEREDRPLVVDARSEGARSIDGMIPGAVPLEGLIVTDGSRGRDAEVVVYCACPNEATAARVAKRLQGLGFARVRPLAGGIHAWHDAGFSLQFP
jgi:rhodanese-related sulfurtransferase